MNEQESNPNWEPSKPRYYGSQVKRGGGEFVGSDNFDLAAARKTLKDRLPSAAPATQANADALVLAFAPLRALSQQAPESGLTIDRLEQELRKNTDANDEKCVKFVNLIAADLPSSAETLRTLFETAPVDQLALPLTRAAIVQLLAA
jgi:hypothetical protein